MLVDTFFFGGKGGIQGRVDRWLIIGGREGGSGGEEGRGGDEVLNGEMGGMSPFFLSLLLEIDWILSCVRLDWIGLDWRNFGVSNEERRGNLS